MSAPELDAAGRNSPGSPDPETSKRLGAWHFFQDFPRILPYARRYWGLVAGSFGLVGGSVLIGLATPWPLAIVIDSVLGNKPLPGILQPVVGDIGRYTLLALAAGAGLFVAATAQGLSVVDNYVNTKLDQRMALDFRSDLFQHVQRLSLAFHDLVPTGGLMYQINNQANSMGQIAVAFPPLAQALLTLLGMFVISFKIDRQVALLSLTVVPLIYYSAAYYAKRIEPRLYQVRNLEGQSLAIVYEAMAMLRVISAFGRESHEYGRFRRQAETALDARVKLTVRQTLFSLAIGVITAAGTSLVLGVGAVHVIQGTLTIGELVVLLGYIAAIYLPLQQISYTLSTLQQQFVGLRGALELLDMERDIDDAPDAIDVGRAEGRVTFENLTFAYRSRSLEKVRHNKLERRKRIAARLERRKGGGRKILTAMTPGRGRRPELDAAGEDHAGSPFQFKALEQADRGPVLRNVSFEAEPGQRVAVVGPTGAGKSTLVNLIPRFYDPTEGVVSLDGVDLRKLSQRSLREQIAVVHQEPLLFSGTIYDNIAYGRLGASDDEIVEAARAANAHRFIMNQPEQYQTQLGERGAQLSGGERQRIAVARAFLKDAPILILDEPTSAIDSQTEAVILDALDRLMEGRTTFMIAHRLSTIRGADVILVMSRGEVVERGTHDDLVEANGLYRRLWDAQTRRQESGGDATLEPAEEVLAQVEPPGPEHVRAGRLLVGAVAEVLRGGGLERIQKRAQNFPPRARRATAPLLVAISSALNEGSREPLADVTRSIAVTGLPARVALALLQDEADETGLRATAERLRSERERLQRPSLRLVLLDGEPWVEVVEVQPRAMDGGPAGGNGRSDFPASSDGDRGA